MILKTSNLLLSSYSIYVEYLRKAVEKLFSKMNGNRSGPIKIICVIFATSQKGVSNV